MKFPEELFYTKSHEWVKKIEDGKVVVGITDFAQHQLGDIVYVDFLIQNDQDVLKGDAYAEIESVKAVESSYMPVSGKVVEINGGFGENHGLINSSPYDKGWLIKIIPSNSEELSSLLNHKQYEDYTKELE